MIRLLKEKFCEDCPYFDVGVLNSPTNFETFEGVYETYGDTVVGCIHLEKCNRVAKLSKGEKE